MMETVARLTSRLRIIVKVPLLSPELSAQWLRLFTDVDLTTARSLVDSLVNDVVVGERDIEALTGRRPARFVTVAADALAERVRRRAADAPA